MRSELKVLEKLVEKEAGKDPNKYGNVARAVVKLHQPVLLDAGLKGRFSWGRRGKISAEVIKPCKIVAFNFDSAFLDGKAAKFQVRKDEDPWLEDYIPFTALPAEVLSKIASESEVA